MKDHPNRHLYMDIKDVDLKQLATLVQEHEVTSQVLLASPRHDELVEWKSMLPDSQTLLWIGGKTEAEQKEKFESARARKFEGLTQVQIHTHLETDATSITRSSVKPFRQSEEFLISAGQELRDNGVLFQTLCYGGT